MLYSTDFEVTLQICCRGYSNFNTDMTYGYVTIANSMKLIECGSDEISPSDLFHMPHQLYLKSYTSLWISHNLHYETEIYLNISPH